MKEQSIKAILYPGSFDPITLGHVDVISRLARLFPKVIVLITDNPRKNYVLNRAERMQLVEKVLRSIGNVEVMTSDALTVDVAGKMEVALIARSVRTVTDWEYEYTMAFANKKLVPGLETFFIMASPELGHISSSLVREVAQFGGDISAFVPVEVAEVLSAKFPKP